MTFWRCESCGGEYEDPCEDGGPYFHVCPRGTVEPRDERQRVVVHRNERTGATGAAYEPRSEGKGRKAIARPPAGVATGPE